MCVLSVLAFTGAPASFPVQESNRRLHRYLEWNDNVLNKAKEFISTLPYGPFIGIHLRNGVDWVSNEHRFQVKDSSNTYHYFCFLPLHILLFPLLLSYYFLMFFYITIFWVAFVLLFPPLFLFMHIVLSFLHFFSPLAESSTVTS